MRFTISKDITANDTIYILTIRESDFVKIHHTIEEIELIDELGKSDKISDKVLALKIITESIERGMQNEIR